MKLFPLVPALALSGVVSTDSISQPAFLKQSCSRSCFLSPVKCPGQGTVSYGKNSSKFGLLSFPLFALL